jgi:hypothetical protein
MSLTFCAETCWAGASGFELRITPEVPREFQSITVHALQPPCGSFSPLSTHEVVGNVVRVIVPYSETLLCSPSPFVPFQWSVPGLPAGNYRLELVDGSPAASPYAVLEAIDIQVALGAVPQPQVVPSTSWLGLGTLALLFAMTGLWQWGRRR